MRWLLKTPLFKWAYRQGGIDSFALAQKDILETMDAELETKAEALAKKKLEALLTVVDENMVVKLDARNGVVFIGGSRPDDTRLSNLRSEAEFFSQSELWKIIHESPKALAQKAMFTDGDSLDHFKKGRSMLYTLDTQARILEVFKSYVKK